MNHRCSCQTAHRRLALIFKPLEGNLETVEELVEKFGFDWHSEFSTAVARIGPGSRFQHPADIRDMLLAVLGPKPTQSIRAAWIDSGPLERQVGELLGARSINHFSPDSRSPLAEILEQRRLQSWYQPIYDRRGALWAYECLMRATGENGETIFPGKIFEWAEQENLLFMLDRVARETHIHNSAHASIPEHVKLLINFTPTVIYEPTFCLRTTFEAVRDSGLNPDRIIFEVIETDKVKDASRLRGILDHYRQAGFGVALDDVSAGYAGLSMMADLEPDLVKIDMDIAQRAVQSGAHMEVIRSLVQLGRRMGKKVLAEGIETAAQHAALRDAGVDLFQGYLLGRPAPEPVGVDATLA